MKQPKPNFHPSCPKRLVTALRRAKSKNGKKWSFSALARAIGVNKGTIYKLAIYGKPPHSEEIRLKLFLPRHPRKKNNPSPAGRGAGVRVKLSPSRLWWNKQPKSFKDSVILREYDLYGLPGVSQCSD